MNRSTMAVVVLLLCAACGEGPSPLPAASPSSTNTPTQPHATAAPSPSRAPWINFAVGLTFAKRGARLGFVITGTEATSDIMLRNGSDKGMSEVAVELLAPSGSGFTLDAVSAPCSEGTLPARSSCTITVRFAAGEDGDMAEAELRASATDASGQPMVATRTVNARSTPFATFPIPAYTTAGGGNLAFGGDGVIHAVVSNVEEAFRRRIDGEVIYDDASAYLRSADGGATWGRDQLMGGYGPAIAASGGDVYLVLRAYACIGGVGFTHNPKGGARDAWSPTTCLAGDYGEQAAVAAAGKNVYVASAARHPRGTWIHVSRDRGRTWTHRRVGTSGQDPIVAASGPTVVVAALWTRGSRAWISRDRGRHWTAVDDLPDGAIQAIAVRAGRVAIAGSSDVRNEDGERELGPPWLRIWSSDGDPVDVALPPGGEEPFRVTALALAPGGGIGVVGGLGWDACGSYLGSTDEGSTWSGPYAVPGCADTRGSLLIADDGLSLVLSYDASNDAYLVARGKPVTRP